MEETDNQWLPKKRLFEQGVFNCGENYILKYFYFRNILK
jgi:hypothetical protein